MPKRSAAEAQNVDRARFVKTTKDDTPQVEDEDGVGEYEDPWEDEVESDEGEDKNQDDAMDVDSDDGLEEIEELEEDQEEEREEEARPFILGIDELPEGHILEADDSLYIMRHDFNLDGESCFSFDILRDNLGDERQRLPTSAYIVAGSQAQRSGDNSVSVAKLSSLHRTQTHDDSDDSDDEDYEALDEDPVAEQRSIPHVGAVNRIRAQRLATPVLPPVSQPYYAASLSDTGKVHIYNVRPLMEALDVPGYSLDRQSTSSPIFTVNSHRTEGYAMDWNAPAASSLGLLTGDNDSRIYLTTAANADFRPSPTAFLSHDASVEDLQWSPTEITVFASCSADRSIRVWDIRSKARQSVASIVDSHNSDVNVISWNRMTSYLLLSGGDEGDIRVWDLRNIRQTQAQVACFDWHRGPITSIEWHPTDDSVFAAASDDSTVSLWDLALEADEDEVVSSGNARTRLPPQLLFPGHYHEHVKDLHWHPQIPGTVISTGVSGLNIFKTINA